MHIATFFSSSDTFDLSNSFSFINPYVYISDSPLFCNVSKILSSIFCSLFFTPKVVSAFISVVSNLSYP